MEFKNLSECGFDNNFIMYENGQVYDLSNNKELQPDSRGLVKLTKNKQITYRTAKKFHKILFPDKEYTIQNSPKRERISVVEGQIFNTKKVLYRDYDPPFKSHSTAYKVECQVCGTEWTLRKEDLKKDCPYCKMSGGRGHKLIKQGDRFGLLTVISNDYNHEQANPRVLCQCDCGSNPKWISVTHLLGKCHSHTVSCGCYQRSSGELKIRQILLKNNISFKEQYQIRNFSKFSLFDFALFKNDILLGLIEYDGKQHFEPVNRFGGEEKFKIQQERDNRKNEYCKNNNIRLVRIPYTDYNKINIEYLFSFFPELHD